MPLPDVGRFYVATRAGDGTLEVRVDPRQARAMAGLWMGFVVLELVLLGVMWWVQPVGLTFFTILMVLSAAIGVGLARIARAPAVWRARPGLLAFHGPSVLGEHQAAFDAGTLVVRAFLTRADLFVEAGGRKHAPWRPTLGATSLVYSKRYLAPLARALADEAGLPFEERGWGL